MSKRLSRKEFLAFLEVIYEEGPPVRYQNPDSWTRFIQVSAF